MIRIERGALDNAGALVSGLISEASQVFLVSETGVPDVWKEKLRGQFPGSPMFIFDEGEQSKCMQVYERLLTWLAEHKATRKDMIVALGGGVTGDLAGFAAATYMRGIQYVNIPTTVLSQVDSSIGGKTAIDLGGIKNIVGAFHQPSMVLIDPDTLSTLSGRQLANGLAEAVKTGMIRDPELLELFEAEGWEDHLDEIIYRSVMVKRAIVEEDENEASVRKLLNFGHTYGHAFESYYEGKYLHGECVAMGMITILKDEAIRSRLVNILVKLGLPLAPANAPDRGPSEDPDFAASIANLIMNDKKAAGGSVDIVQVDVIGDAHIESWPQEQILRWLEKL